MTLEELRIRIDELDRQLVELLSERARAAQMVGHLKAATSLPVYEPAREKVVYANVRAANKGPLPDIELTHIYERIIDVMRCPAEGRVGIAKKRPGRTEWAWPCRGRTRRPRQGTSNDCSHAGEGHRRADRCRHRRHGGFGVNVHRTTGAYQTILAGVGPTANVELRKFELLPGVLYVHRITAPYKLAGRAFRPEGTQVEFANGVKIGGDRIACHGRAVLH